MAASEKSNADKMLALFDRQRVWRVEDLAKKMGMRADRKPIYNTLAILRQRNKIARLAYGVYEKIVPG